MLKLSVTMYEQTCKLFLLYVHKYYYLFITIIIAVDVIINLWVV